jgi:hypothetical protein
MLDQILEDRMQRTGHSTTGSKDHLDVALR